MFLSNVDKSVFIKIVGLALSKGALPVIGCITSYVREIPFNSLWLCNIFLILILPFLVLYLNKPLLIIYFPLIYVK